jgi:hypothetical protein
VYDEYSAGIAKKQEIMFKIVFFVTEEHAEAVKQAMFNAGAGKIGEYECCAWQCAGTGQFRGLAHSDPFVGSAGQMERIPELRVEMVCADECIDAAIEALLAVHPYETPAFDVFLQDFRASRKKIR